MSRRGSGEKMQHAPLLSRVCLCGRRRGIAIKIVAPIMFQGTRCFITFFQGSM